MKIFRHAIGPSRYPVLEEDTALFEDGGQRPVVVSHLLLEDGERAHALQTVVERYKIFLHQQTIMAVRLTAVAV